MGHCDRGTAYMRVGGNTLQVPSWLPEAILLPSTWSRV